MLYRPVQYSVHVLPSRSARNAPANAGDPRVRDPCLRPLPRRRGARVRAPLDRPGGIGRRRLLAAADHRRDHVDPPRSRPLPRQGSRSGRDVRGADGQGRGYEPGPRWFDAHRRSHHRDLRGERDRGCRCSDRGGRRGGVATAPRRRRRGGVLRRRRRSPRDVSRGDQPRIGVGAAGHLLLREQRLRRVLPRVDAARRAARAARRGIRRRVRGGRRQRRRRDGRCDVVRGRGDPSRRWADRDRGRHLPLARPLRGRPGAVPDTRRGEGVGGPRPPHRQRAPPPVARCHRRRPGIDAGVGRAGARWGHRVGRADWRRPGPRR